jgi:predicted ferric reductase
MNRDLVVASGVFAASLFGGMALNAGDLGHLPWMLSRVSGLVAFALLTSSVIFGLLMSTKAADGFFSRPFVYSIHQFLSVVTLTFLGVHAGSLLFDGFLKLGPADILIPFATSYEPFWVGLGIVSAWLTAIVTASFWMRGRIGQKAWRKLHYASFIAYVFSLVHGVMSGTDTALPLVTWMYLLSAASVAGLLVYRVGLRGQAPVKRPIPRRSLPADAA